MIIAGQHGRDTARFMKLHDTHDHTIQAILKPNSSVDVLIETALNNTNTFTKKDIVLLWILECINFYKTITFVRKIGKEDVWE
ncbi:hypothetical protein JTB14_025625 [Gonioctena quinquepunctata]|nr:hypothetical protein JTB14_025625 [Gonioctena quinquepunctata]